MKVQSVLQFTKQFFSFELDITSYDRDLLSQLNSYFIDKSSDADLSQDAIEFIINCYKKRWEQIENTQYDYTLGIYSASQKWIDFAKELACSCTISYISILFPTITNKIDQNNGSELTETENLTNLYVGENNLLYRKRALCEHIQKYGLSTFRSLSERQCSIVTLGELSRLRRCQQSKGAFSIAHFTEEERFTNFWDFLKKKSFPRLTKSGEVPRTLLPYLLNLVENYYTLKSEKLDFSNFKRLTRYFFNRLYGYNLLNVNCFYGQNIIYKDENAYLLDVFLAIFEAETYDLNHEMNVLAEFLFKFNPILKAKNHEFIPLYIKLTKFQVITLENEQINAYERCFSILVSLYVSKFPVTFISRASIDVWDIENTVPIELVQIANDLQLILSIEQANYVTVYKHILQELIIPKLNDKGWYTWFIRDQSTAHWLDQVRNTQLAQVGGYWFEPECILSVLCDFYPDTVDLKTGISGFLNDIIRTYAQSQNDIQKKLRVNILFSKFLSGLSENQRRSLIILLALCDKKDAQIKFIDNCDMHIKKQLESLGYILPVDASPHFFCQPSRQVIKLQVSTNPQKVIGLIDAYTKKLEIFHLEVKLSSVIKQFFFQLKEPILTIKDKEDIIKSVPSGSDPIGAST